MAYAEPDPVSEEEFENMNADLDVKDRQTRIDSAVALRVAGAAYSEIAEVLGYTTPAMARQAVERAIASTADEESRESVRQLLMRRTDRLTRAVWSKAIDPENPEQLAAVRTAVVLIDRHAKLAGADAPQELNVYTPTVREVETLLRQISDNMRNQLPKELDVIEGQVIDDA